MVAINLPGTQAATVARAVAGPGGGYGSQSRYGLVARFKVQVKDLGNLGNWASCSGLSVQFKPDTLPVGGQYASATYLPGEVEYGEITLERAMEPSSSKIVKDMLSRFVRDWANWDGSGAPYQGKTVTITLLDSQGARKVVEWTLQNAIPKSWSGPTLNGRTNEVATEKLVFCHGGFL